MAVRGTFDPELNVFSLFDVGLRPEAWFDPELTGDAVESDVFSAFGSVTFTGTANLTARVAIAASGTLTFSQTAVLSGRGSLTASASILLSGQGTIRGLGALASAGTLVFTQAATLSGRGGMAASGVIVFVGTAANDEVFRARGTLTFSSIAALTGRASGSASGGIAFTSIAAMFRRVIGRNVLPPGYHQTGRGREDGIHTDHRASFRAHLRPGQKGGRHTSK